MNILSAEEISKSYSEKVLLKNISLGINEGDKIGLIGINGTGKSTLLKLLSGIEAPDTGRIIKTSSLTIEYLPQNPVFEAGLPVIQHTFRGNSNVMKLLREYEKALTDFNSDHNNKAWEKRLMDLTFEMDKAAAWSIESEAKAILTKLGIEDFNTDIGSLSGGQRKRVALAGALINPSELLILDEPTNHIDNETVDWLESYLNKRKGALLMVTHDRYFLDRIANRIIELDKGSLYSYQGNYSKFVEMKMEREELLESSERKRKSLFRKELEWIRQGAQARSTKQKARIDRFNKLKDEEVTADSGSLEIKSVSTRLGRKIIELENISKSYGNKELIKDLSYILLRDDRIGIIGPNGSGKTTLLKMITGKLQPDKGRVTIGDTVKIGFFSQENEELNDKLRVLDYIKEGGEIINTIDGTVSASQMLERFLFPTAIQWTPISRLSGGEKRRLYLLRVLMEAPNILLLDEPTNDLDIETLKILESYLDDFAGAIIAVSHDRYFLDRIATKIFSFEGNGFIRQYSGNYTDYIEFKKKAQEEAILLENNRNSVKPTQKQENKKERPLKLTYKEQKEFDSIDGIIAELEEQIKTINTEINNSSSDYEKLQKLLEEKNILENKLNEAVERWAYLNELVEEIEQNLNKTY